MSPGVVDKSTKTEVALFRLSGQVLTDDDLEGEHWYQCVPEWPENAPGGLQGSVDQWSQVAEEALQSASRMYEKKMDTHKGEAMKKAFGRDKTISDQIASVTLLIQESPVHRLDEIQTLLSYTQKKVRRERRLAIEAMKDLFINDLLPDDRRLISFQARQFSCAKGTLSKRHLAYALFESELKNAYRDFLEVLEENGNDSIVFIKEKAVKTISELLIAKPEGERALLAMLVNKLGDPEKVVSSKAAYCLTELIVKHHPQMRLIVIREVEQLLTRPNVTRKTQYYAIMFLNQMQFSDGDVELARRFVRIYMDLFTKCLEEDKIALKSVSTDKVRKRMKRNRKRGRAKDMKQKVEVKDQEGGAAAKESRLMGALLNGVNRAFPYTKPEQDSESYQSYYDSLFHVAHAKSLHPATQALAFVFQVTYSTSTQSDRFYRALYARIYDAAAAGETTQAAFLNLLFNAIKSDPNSKRKKAYVKRLMQAGLHGSAAFAGACAVVVSEVFAGKDIGILKSFVSLPENDDEDEHFTDVDEESDTKEQSGDDNRSEDSPKKGDTTEKDAITKIDQLYDPKKRDPQYAGAERSSLWEAVSMCSHYHPSIALFASQLCKDLKKVSYEGDPLHDFAEISFLDKFSYKKAKNRIATSLYGKRAARYRDDPVANTQEFQELVNSGDVAEDTKFFATFFSANPDRVQRPRDPSEVAKRDADGSYIDSENEAFEQAVEAEMRRLGADEGFFAGKSSMPLGDIDVEDEDELKAFNKAFGKEMEDSEQDTDGNSVSSMEEDDDEENGDGNFEGGLEQVLPLNPPGVLVDNSDVDSSSEEDSELPGTNGLQKAGTSVFAAAEDFAEAIDKDIPVEDYMSSKVMKTRSKKRNGGSIDVQKPKKKHRSNSNLDQKERRGGRKSRKTQKIG